MVRGSEPKSQRLMTVSEERTTGYRKVVAAFAATIHMRLLHPNLVSEAGRATWSVGPADTCQIRPAVSLRGKPISKFRHRSGVVRRDPRLLHLVDGGVKCIGLSGTNAGGRSRFLAAPTLSAA